MTISRMPTGSVAPSYGPARRVSFSKRLGGTLEPGKDVQKRSDVPRCEIPCEFDQLPNRQATGRQVEREALTRSGAKHEVPTEP
jgi:hypothetical protein